MIIKSTNYADATVNVVITLTAKDIPNITAVSYTHLDVYKRQM